MNIVSLQAVLLSDPVHNYKIGAKLGSNRDFVILDCF